MKMCFAKWNENTVRSSYKSPEKENRDKRTELRPLGLLAHKRQEFF
jgi:hypothetical protein